MEKAVFFSGTHGSGKTTTIKTVSELTKFRIYSSSDGDHGNPYIKHYPRQVWRLTKYYLDSLEVYQEQRLLHQQERLLVDRCIFDHEAYTRTFQKTGNITIEQLKLIENISNIYFDKSLMPNNIVFLIPELGWIISRIKYRWNEEKEKWNEGDFDYLRILHQEYEQIALREKQKRNVLIVNETKLEERVSRITNFLNELIS